jgi:outer membrane protein TolC
MISAYASGGAKNGYIPDLNQIRANYQVGVGLAVPIFDAYRTKYNLKQTESAINTLGYETESTKRSITAEVSDAMESVKSTLQKIDQYELQLEEARQAYSLAQISFKAGAITNLDLLDTNTTLSESSLLLLKAKIDHVSSIYRLKAALGERLY